MSLTQDDSCKLSQKGWIDSDEEKTNNIPDKCPKCGHPLWVVNAANLLGIYLVMCRNSQCRWCIELKVE